MKQAAIRKGRDISRDPGLAFEAHTETRLRAMMAAPPPPPAAAAEGEDGGSLAAALRGGALYTAGGGIPCRALVQAGYIPRDPRERQRLAEDERTHDGWREWAFDKLVVRADGGIVAVQDKNHRVLTLGPMATFHVFARRCFKANRRLELPTAGTALLTVPGHTRLSSRVCTIMGEDYLEDIGLAVLRFPDFALPASPQPRLPGCERQDAEDEREDDLVDVPDALAVVAPPAPAAPPGPRMGAATTRAARAAATDAVAIDLFDHQAAAVAAVEAATAGTVALVVGPPGSGKTEILCRLVTNALLKDARTLVLVTAPLIDHAKNWHDRFLERGFAAEAFGGVANFRKKVTLVADKDVRQEHELAAAYNRGVRVFVSTDASAEELRGLLLRARKAKRPPPALVLKDEAHFNSGKSRSADDDAAAVTYAASTQLLLEADRAVGATATPNPDVLNLPGARVVWRLTIPEAQRLKLVAPYQIVIPTVTDGSDVPVGAEAIAARDKPGLAALFLVQAMLEDGSRRCVAFAANGAEALAVAEALPLACAFHSGTRCVVELVHQHKPADGALKGRACTKEQRSELYGAFQTAPTHEARASPETGEPQVRTTLHFLVSVDVLNMAVDLPACDSTFLVSPPASNVVARESVLLAIQRHGRAWRFREDKLCAHNYVFADQDAPFLGALLDTLAGDDFGDADVLSRVKVRSVNTYRAHTAESVAREASDLQALRGRFAIGAKRDAEAERAAKRERNLAEICRLVLLVDAKAVDPETQAPARMPKQRQGPELDPDNRGMFWNNIKSLNNNVDELKQRLGSGFDVVAFLASQRKGVTEWSALSLAGKWALLHAWGEAHKRRPSAHNEEDADEKRLGEFVNTLVADRGGVRTRLRASVGAKAFDAQWKAFDALPTNQEVENECNALANVETIAIHAKKHGACPAKRFNSVGPALSKIRDGRLAPALLPKARDIVERVLPDDSSLTDAQRSAKQYLLDSLQLGANKHAEYTAKVAERNHAKRAAVKAKRAAAPDAASSSSSSSGGRVAKKPRS